MTVRVVVQAADFDPAAEMEALGHDRPGIGAVASFIGLCRDEGGRLAALEIEHYPGMAEAEIGRVAEDAAARFGLSAVTVVHRHGTVRPGDRIVLVATASPHRDAAFDGARFLMDYLKTSAPFWKRELDLDGRRGEWVSAKASDDAARGAWARDGRAAASRT